MPRTVRRDPRVDGDAAPVSISMTDRAGWAVCLLGPAGPQPWLRPGTRRAAHRTVHPRLPHGRAKPKPSWPQPAGPQRDLAANLLWSAKESALKVLRTGLRRDTRSVEVTHGSRTVEGWREIAMTVDGERVFPGWWQRFGDFVLTVAADAGDPLPAPAPLSRLRDWPAALPHTSWMRQPLCDLDSSGRSSRAIPRSSASTRYGRSSCAQMMASTEPIFWARSMSWIASNSAATSPIFSARAAIGQFPQRGPAVSALALARSGELRGRLRHPRIGLRARVHVSGEDDRRGRSAADDRGVRALHRSHFERSRSASWRTPRTRRRGSAR